MVEGVASLSVHNNGAGTAVTRMFARDPYRWLFPRDCERELLQAVPVVTAGGIVGGDSLTLDIAAMRGARLNVVGQAPEKLYRSAGAAAQTTVALRAGANAWLEWMPQGAIVFDGAKVRRRIDIDADVGARVLAGELVYFGRQAMGESFTAGLVDEAWRLRVGGRLIWADRLRLAGGAALEAPFAFAGARAYATLIYVGPDAADGRDWARAGLPAAKDGLRLGVTAAQPGLLLCRLFGPDGAALRGAFAQLWVAWRRRFGGHAARMPRLWEV